MSLRLIRAVAKTEISDDFHMGRLLILLRTKDKCKKKTVEGIMKLAKLDFLLRYPNCLERALKATGKDPNKANLESYERDTIESQMIRFKYGPWDHRYRRWIGLFLAKGLVKTYIEGKTIHIGLTDRGREIADQLTQLEEFRELTFRSELIVKAVGTYPATKLKIFIYTVFPELETMKWGEKISL